MMPRRPRPGLASPRCRTRARPYPLKAWEAISHDPTDEHHGEIIDSAGRLAVYAGDTPAVHIHDLDNGAAVEATHPTDGPVSAIYAGPQQRYAVLYQATANQVQFVDGGLWREDHGDHLHDYRQASRPMDWRLRGPRPSHYNVQAGRQAAVFMDGPADASQPASSSLIDDAAIARGRPLARLNLDIAIHGLAVPIDDLLISVTRAADAADTGPTHLQRFHRSGSSYTAGTLLPTRCDRLHGAFDDGRSLVTGCGEGMLLARHGGADGVDDGTVLRTPIRVSTIAGHPLAAGHLIGIGTDGTAPAPVTTRFFALDANAATVAELVPQGWESGRVRRAHAFDRSGQRFHIVDDLGTLYILQRDGATWATRARLPGVIPAMPTAAPWPALVACGSRDALFLTDPLGRRLLTLDPEAGTVRSSVPLAYVPGGLAWLGIAR